MREHFERWKEELRVFRDQVAKIEPATADFEGERSIFYSAFIIRKLIEDASITDTLRSRSIDAVEYPATTTADVRFFARVIEETLDVSDHFDLNKPKTKRINYEDLASEIIHADAFVWQVKSPAPGAFFVASYRNSQARLLSIPLGSILDMIDRILEDKPKEFWSEQNITTGHITRHSK